MKSVAVGIKAMAVGAALLAGLGTVQAATVDGCRAAVGFKVNPGGGAWGAVQASSDSFLARRMIPQCEVKVVGTSVKAKPPTTTEILAEQMTQDECSMYNHLSAVDSKLNQAKTGDAYVTIGAMIAKLNEMLATGKLDQGDATKGYTYMFAESTKVQSCIAELMSQ